MCLNVVVGLVERLPDAVQIRLAVRRARGTVGGALTGERRRRQPKHGDARGARRRGRDGFHHVWHLTDTLCESNIRQPILMSRRTRISLVTVGLVFLVVACNSAPPAPPFKPIADVKQLMQGTIDPNADALWDAVGWIDTESGTEERRPRSQAEWDAVRNNAITLTEA